MYENSVTNFGITPPTKESNADIDIEETERMLRYGIENGINIIDTAYPYHSAELDGRGNSEVVIGNFLKENSYRDDILLSTKSPSWLMEKHEDFEYYFEQQLKDLQTDYVDIYLLHSLTETDWPKVRDLNVLDFLDDCLSSGRVKHVGFSAHTEIDYVIEIIDEYPKWEVCLTQMNYLDEYYQSGVMGLDYFKELNIGSMVMEPLRGGRLIQNIPPSIEKLWDMAEVKRTPLEWAFQYLWNMEEVNTVLSGMNSLEQVKENLEIANRSEINSISENDLELIKEVAWEYKQRRGNDCTGCGYCMPCPHKVDVASCFREYNVGKMLNNPAASAFHYFSLDPRTRADRCLHCDDCLNHCPQMIHISEDMKKVEEFFGMEEDYV